jgi:predicted ATPase
LLLILTTVRRLCAPLAYLHGEGFVHRDLKPDNIIIRPDGMPVIVDFGLLSQFGGQISREALEVEIHAVGTLQYVSPEQVRGELVDARADLFSLGCILYELLTGRQPFPLLSPEDLYGVRARETPEPLSSLMPALPSELNDLVTRLLTKDLHLRVGYAEDVAAALASLGAQDGLAASGPKPRPYLYRPGFVGRSAQLSVLGTHLKRLVTGHGNLVLMEGESGVGKSRLAVEFGREAAQQGVLVMVGDCTEAGARALQAFRKPLQTIADKCREQGANETERLLGRRGKLLALYEPALIGLPGQDLHPSPAHLPEDAARLRLFIYLDQTLAALAENGPILFVIDDLQWADELTLAFLQFLLRGDRLGRLPVLIVGTYRAEEVSEGIRNLLQAPGSVKVCLDRLEEEAVRAMIGDMLALTPAPQAFSRYLARHSEGSPFFVAEYMRAAVGEGILWRDKEGSWQVPEPTESQATKADYEWLPLPSSLRELVGRRLEGLPKEAAALTQVASAVGRDVRLTLLEEIADLPESDLMAALDELLCRQIVEQAEPGILRFVHDKIREVAYEHVQTEQRPNLHRAVAEAMELLFAGEHDLDLAELGRHWELAGEMKRAQEYYLGGARRAKERYAYREAEQQYRAYLSLVEQPTPESVAARNELGREILYTQSRNLEAITEYERALSEARQLSDRQNLAAALIHLSAVHGRMGQIKEARRLGEEALALARDMKDRALEAGTLGNLGELERNQGNLQAARGLFEETLRIAREVGGHSSEGRTVVNLAILEWQQGNLEKARSLYERALTIDREASDRRSEAHTMVNLAILEWQQGNIAAARGLYNEALGILREVGYRRLEGGVLGNLANLEHDEGNLEEARRLYESALSIARETGDRRNEGIWLSNLAQLERRMGSDLEHVARLHDDALALLRELGDTYLIASFLCYYGHFALSRQRPAEDFLTEARALAVELGAGHSSELGQTLAALERAVEASNAGQDHRLFRGELIEDIPERLRNRLLKTE